MKGHRITVCVFGPKGDFKWKSPPAPDYEEQDYTVVHYIRDDLLNEAIKEWNPNIFVTFGPWQNYKTLAGSSLEVRRKWIDATGKSPGEIGAMIMARYMETTLMRSSDRPKISVFTAACNSGHRILRPMKSLVNQTYKDFEWVIVDDSEGHETMKVLESMADFDARVKVFKPGKKSGRIGEVKKWACGLCTGDILVELDHDDELTMNCLEDISQCFKQNHDVGFAYTDCAEVFENGQNWEYPLGWGMGFGSYRNETYQGKVYRVTNYPPINAKTIRHIVGAPNHARAWRKSVYDKIGGHNPDIHVADDYELMLRTFLYTRMAHIQKFGYIQYRNEGGNNQTFVRNREIQRLVRYFKEYYDLAIHARCEQLGVKDPLWVNGTGDLNLGNRADLVPISINFPSVS
jgi:glycosyltransferase involved in cell wall biosynthesis